METIEQTPPQTETPKFKLQVECKNCHTTFGANKPSAMFCGNRCRMQYNRANPKQQKPAATSNETPAPVLATQLVASLGRLDPSAQYIITSQEKEINRWENKFNKEEARRIEAEKKVAELKDQIKDHEHKQALNGIESELKKPGLEEKLLGFLATPLGEKLGGVLIDKLLPAGGALMGADGQLDEGAQTQMAQITAWFTSLPEDQRTMVLGILQNFAASAPEQLTATLQRITNLLKNGSTVTNYNAASAAANY